MQQVLEFALLGLGIGAIYALAGQALIVVYRGSGVLSLSLGATGMAGAYVDWELQTKHGWPFAAALTAGTLSSILIGVLTQALVMRRLRRASSLVRIIATLGILFTIESAATLRYGSVAKYAPNELTVSVLRISGTVSVPINRLILLGIAVAGTTVLWAVYRYTRFGLATTAVTENEALAAGFGWSPNRIAIANWAIGSGIIGAAAILIAPIISLQITTMTSLTLAALAATLMASMRNFWIALVAGVAIGVAETELHRFVTQQGFADSVPFLVIIALLALTGKGIPLRDHLLQRLPSVGSGQIRWLSTTVAVAVAVVLVLNASNSWQAAIIVSLASGLVLLSVVVLTGYTGQLSLGQFALAGFAALVAGRLADAHGLPFWLALPSGAAAAVPIGLIFALPAVRTRGITLAIVTLGLGIAMQLMVFENSTYTGGVLGTNVGSATLFGLDVGAIAHPARFGIVVLACFVLGTLSVANVRRGRTGRRLLAVRTNERAAAAMGISVVGAKLYAFGFAAALAGVGGVLLAYSVQYVDYSTFTSDQSIYLVGLALIGGIGYLTGPLLGGVLVAGGIGTQLLTSVGIGGARYIPLIGGISIVLLVLGNPDGQASQLAAQVNWIARHLPLRRQRVVDQPGPPEASSLSAARTVDPHILTVRNVSVRYGGIVAVDRVSLDVVPGRVTGLIGPNGAGKSSLIDAITGFTRIGEGSVTIDDRDASRWPPIRRARAGIARSFQSLELFDDATVLENLRVAAEPRDIWSYFRDLVWPRKAALPDSVLAAISAFELDAYLDVTVENLPYGKRRLLAIARAVAMRPSVLLLDEPGAGLGQAELAELAVLIRRLVDDWGLGVLVVEHDVNFVMSVCDTIVVLDFGRKIAEGSPADVAADPVVIAAYLGDEREPDDAPARPVSVVRLTS